MRATRYSQMTNAEWICAMKRILAWNCICGSSSLTIYIFERISS